MNNLDKIQSAAYVLVTELVKHHLVESEVNYSGLARVHLDTVQYISEAIKDDFGVNSDILSLYPIRATEATQLVIKNMLGRSENQEFIKEVSDGFRMGLNPIKFFAREAIRDIEDTTEYLKLRPVIRESALPVVLSAIDEMLTRGVQEKEMIQGLSRTYLFINGCENISGVTVSQHKVLEASFERAINDCWEHGEVDGSIDSGAAKVGKITGGVSGAIAGAKVGAVIGSVIPVFGTVVGVAVGGVAGNFLGKAFGEELTRPDLNNESSVKRNDNVEAITEDVSRYAGEAIEAGKELSKKASRFFSNW